VARRTDDRITGTAVLVLLSLALASCTAAAPSLDGPDAESSASAEATASPYFTGLVDIGGDRELYLDCRGSGSPTVLLISGTRGAADEWTTLLPDAAPEVISTFDALAEKTRVCAYDRPGTTIESGELTHSTVVPQPTTARQAAEDLRALMAAVEQPGPFVVVGLSWGGMIAQQFARTYPDEVDGLVLLDAASIYLQETFTPEQWSAWMALVASSVDAAGSEVPAYEPSIAELHDTPAIAGIPVVVMSSDQPWDLQVTPGASTWPAWVAAQALLAESLDATHITRTDSGHGLPVEQPARVTDAILSVVDSARPG
jgi:pimeloyl-ACP methyl ester carboxylesterase